MIKYNTKNTKHIHLFRIMYQNYVDELGQYTKRLRTKPVTRDEMYDVDTNPPIKKEGNKE